MKITNIILVLASWGGWFALERWTNLIGEVLDPIHPYLADVVIVSMFVGAGILWWYDHTRNSPKAKKHSKEIAQGLEIIKEGIYSGKDDVEQFLVPYPYEEYKIEKRKEKFPTVSEQNELVDAMFNSIHPYEPPEKKYEFLPLNEQDDTKLKWAWEHLQHYKGIKEKLAELKKTNLEYSKFFENNKEKCFETINAQKNFQKTDNEFNRQWIKVADKLKNAQDAVHDAIEKLFYDLEGEELVKGKCIRCR